MSHLVLVAHHDAHDLAHHIVRIVIVRDHLDETDIEIAVLLDETVMTEDLLAEMIDLLEEMTAVVEIAQPLLSAHHLPLHEPQRYVLCFIFTIDRCLMYCSPHAMIK